MKTLAACLSLAALASFMSPANAALHISFSSGASTFNCGALGACDLSPDFDQIVLGTTDVGPFQITGTFVTSNAEFVFFPPQLTVSLTIANTAPTTETLLMAVGDNFFAPIFPPQLQELAFFSSGVGAGVDAALTFWVDKANEQPAKTSTDLPGIEVGSFSTLTGVGLAPLHAGRQFAMAEGALLTIPGGGSVTDFNMTMIAVPELSTWAMMLAGFAGLGCAGYRRSQRGLGQNAPLSIYKTDV